VIVVDTSVWIDFFAGRDPPHVTHLVGCLHRGDEEIALTDLILTEVLQGLRTEREVQRVDDHLSVFEILRLHDLSDFRRGAALYRAARRQGVTISRTRDCLIAAVCVRERTPLLHADADFDRLAKVTDLVTVPVAGE
jgi:hypothetical protein